MASRYHWVTGGGSTAFNGQTIFTPVNIAVPAGATMKRFMLKGVQILGYADQTDLGAIHPLSWYSLVEITSGDYAGREIYRTYRRIPMETIGIYNPLHSPGPSAQYAQYVSAGDLEIGFNERCSYGKRTGPGFNVRFSSAIFVYPPGSSSPGGPVSFTFAVLYYL